MDSIYHYIGIVVVWSIAVIIIATLAMIITWCLWALFKTYELKYEFLAYYFGNLITTEELRIAYRLHPNIKARKLAVKYRLRNINKLKELKK